MAQANVYTSVNSQSWYTDKARIATGNSSVTLNVNVVWGADTGDFYSANVQVPPYATRDIWVGVGNELTVNGSDFTAQEIGTTSSGQLAVR